MYKHVYNPILNKKKDMQYRIQIIYRVSQKKGGDWVYSSQKIIHWKIFVIFFFLYLFTHILCLANFFFQATEKALLVSKKSQKACCKNLKFFFCDFFHLLNLMGNNFYWYKIYIQGVPEKALWMRIQPKWNN